MSNPQIENLLNQMSLTGPSSELDERISSCLSVEKNALPKTDVPRSISWSPVIAAAVLFLLVGVVVGRSTATNEVTGTVRPEDAAETIVTERDIEAGNWLPIAQPGVADTIRENPEIVFHGYQAVPEIAMLCAVGMTAPSNTGDQCLSCHTGVGHAQDIFRREHAWQLKQESCGLCHDMSDKRPRGRQPKAKPAPVEAEFKPMRQQEQAPPSTAASPFDLSPTIQVLAQFSAKQGNRL